MDTEPAGQEQHEDPQAEQLEADLSALDLNATAAAQHPDQPTETGRLNLSDELIDSLQARCSIPVIDSDYEFRQDNGSAEHDLTTLQEALRRVRDGHQAINDPIKIKSLIRLYD